MKQKECTLAVKALREPHGYFPRQILELMWSYTLILSNSFFRFCRAVVMVLVGFGWLVIFTAVARWHCVSFVCGLRTFGQPCIREVTRPPPTPLFLCHRDLPASPLSAGITSVRYHTQAGLGSSSPLE